MNLVLHKLIGTLEELSGEDDDGGGTVTDFSVLNLRELDQDLSSGMLDLKQLEDGGTIIGDSYITDIIDEHFIETLRAERALNDVRERLDCHNYNIKD
jgi:hypothetical protein